MVAYPLRRHGVHNGATVYIGYYLYPSPPGCIKLWCSSRRTVVHQIVGRGATNCITRPRAVHQIVGRGATNYCSVKNWLFIHTF